MPANNTGSVKMAINRLMALSFVCEVIVEYSKIFNLQIRFIVRFLLTGAARRIQLKVWLLDTCSVADTCLYLSGNDSSG